MIQAFWQLLSQYNRAYAQAGRLLSQEAYWTLVDHLVQAQRSLELGTLNPKLLMETFILEYAAIINEYDN